jgi:predicted RNase H-like nuclease
MTRVLGVDACPGGWVGVELREGAFAAAHVNARLDQLVRGLPEAAVIAVDMPLGLVDSGWREADRAVHDRLGRRSSSLFVMPPRPVFEQPDHASGSALCKAMTGQGISIQAWGLKAKLFEANSLFEMGAHPLWEVHPELSFMELGLRPDDGGKKTWRGQRARLRVLEAAGITLPEDLGSPIARIPADDVLDAAAAAWSAQRLATGSAQSLPDPPQCNERGQHIAIWF